MECRRIPTVAQEQKEIQYRSIFRLEKQRSFFVETGVLAWTTYVDVPYQDSSKDLEGD
jgi:hypothetical protein